MTRNRTRRQPDPSRTHPPPANIFNLLLPSGQRDIRRFPRLVAHATALVWRAAPRELILAGGLQVLGAMSLAAQLLLTRRVLDRATNSGGAPALTGLAPELLTFGVLLMVVATALVAQREQQRTLSDLVQKYTTGRVMDVSTTAPLIAYDEPGFYDRLQRARVNASIRPLEITNGVVGLVGNGAAVITVGATLLWLEPVIAALFLFGSAPTLWLNRLAAGALHAHMLRQTANERRRTYLYDALSRREEAQEIRAFDSSHQLRAEHDRLYDEKILDVRRTVRRRLWYGTITAAIVAALAVSALSILVWFVQIGRMDVSDAAVAFGAVVIVASRLRGLVASSGSLYEGALFLEDYTDFVATDELLAADNRGLSPPPFREFEFDRVGFTYPSRSEPSLHDISLSIQKGEVIALVGENGSGKTTLTKLLAGLYRPSEGTIRWNGQNLAELDVVELREQVTVIFQDFARYLLTAEENVAISRSRGGWDLDAVQQAAARAGADTFLSRLPDGYRTLLGPSFVGGSDLSTGQWQRVALARAYFRNAPLLILDEPTAALDPRGEYEIFRQVRSLAEGRTVVLVSHRFSSVRVADRILVLDGGRIVEDGSHDDLMSRGGLYAELFDLQAAGYREPRG